MGAVIEVFARWASPDEEEKIAGALRRFCLRPQSSKWLEGIEESYPDARRVWERVQHSLAQLIEIAHPFDLRVSSVSMLESGRDDPNPRYASTLSLGYIDGFSIRHNHPALVEATRDLASLVEALGSTWCMPITLD